MAECPRSYTQGGYLDVGGGEREREKVVSDTHRVEIWPPLSDITLIDDLLHDFWRGRRYVDAQRRRRRRREDFNWTLAGNVTAIFFK